MNCWDGDRVHQLFILVPGPGTDYQELLKRLSSGDGICVNANDNGHSHNLWPTLCTNHGRSDDSNPSFKAVDDIRISNKHLYIFLCINNILVA